MIPSTYETTIVDYPQSFHNDTVSPNPTFLFVFSHSWKFQQHHQPLQDNTLRPQVVPDGISPVGYQNGHEQIYKGSNAILTEQSIIDVNFRQQKF
jgi:hypothetical protein